ncbi:hypothetical protein LshimejAT787_0304330 [Lyophyllum shimeji]|uniref:Uncharacterized protein n=1 Tax=Lyophyllum shimeji TaxID=47721 RepID=A0A9P3ULY6_LYOSH|nr:hypothetical protein LshimejAT787_0304330 [Lyophyllum shimeji]
MAIIFPLQQSLPERPLRSAAVSQSPQSPQSQSTSAPIAALSIVCVQGAYCRRRYTQCFHTEQPPRRRNIPEQLDTLLHSP